MITKLGHHDTILYSLDNREPQRVPEGGWGKLRMAMHWKVQKRKELSGLMVSEGMEVGWGKTSKTFKATSSLAIGSHFLNASSSSCF